MSDVHQEIIPALPPAVPEPEPVPVAKQTTQERLTHLLTLLRKDHGEEFDPMREIATIGNAALKNDDFKTALTAFQAIADRMYPKLRAYEIDVSTDRIDGIKMNLSGLGPGFDTIIEDAEFKEVEDEPRRDLIGDGTGV